MRLDGGIVPTIRSIVEFIQFQRATLLITRWATSFGLNAERSLECIAKARRWDARGTTKELLNEGILHDAASL
jgi:hypothetical protein